MMIWPKANIKINGKLIEAIAPLIISASRSTDIPAFYANDFFDCLKKGYLFWTNPFNGIKIPVSLSNVKFIVFWTKNAKPIIPYLDKIKEMGINFYFNYTLNDYEQEGLEPNLQQLDSRIDVFKQLSDKIGREKVVWRFDPLILPKGQKYESLISKIVKIAVSVHKYTNKLVVSFVDDTYKKVIRNFSASNFEHVEINKNLFMEMLQREIKHYGLEIYTCAEQFEINPEFAKKNKCIDDELIQQLSLNDFELQQFIKILKSKNCIKDKGQRKFCNCMVSKDIGRYNSCMFACTYCYAGNITHLDSKPELFK